MYIISQLFTVSYHIGSIWQHVDNFKLIKIFSTKRGGGVRPLVENSTLFSFETFPLSQPKDSYGCLVVVGLGQYYVSSNMRHTDLRLWSKPTLNKYCLATFGVSLSESCRSVDNTFFKLFFWWSTTAIPYFVCPLIASFVCQSQVL